MNKSIFFKIFSGYFCIAVILALFILSFAFHSIRIYYVSTLTDDLTGMATVLNARIQPFLEKKDFRGMDTYVKALDLRIHRRITVIDASGTVLADSEKDPHRMENHAGRPEVAQALRGAIGTSIRQSSTLGEGMLYVALPLEKDGAVPGVLRISAHVKDINSLLLHLKLDILRLTLIAVLLSLFAAYIFSRKLSRPITLLNHAAGKVSHGDFSAKVYVDSTGELRNLADTFNNMTDQLSVSFTRLSQQKDELHTIIANLQEGLCVIGPDERITLSNTSFRAIMQPAPVEGRFYWEVLREPRFRELMQKARAHNSSVMNEIELKDATYLCNIIPMDSPQQCIVVLRNITQSKVLETIKKDFIGNVSHELRTPLTAIKGYLEMVEDALTGENQRYLKIIQGHTDRLIRIVEDLLLLSELEEQGFLLECAPVDISLLLENVSKIFGQRLKECGLCLRVEVEPRLPAFRGDVFKLEQMFINLIDNAIKYTEKGTISVRARRDDTHLTIEIEDSGIGIPTEHLPRIFERFYVVDKSRSRKAGGTGLGLSIVKHIVLLHNGSIDVQSECGVGTRFSVHLPLTAS
jgi:two-component system phosphate regulon sensor histidine kinase PhoR